MTVGKLRVGIVGAGRRVHDMYAPVLGANDDIEVSGFWNRDAVKGQKLTDAFGYQRCSDLDKLAKDSDALIIAVNSSALTEVTLRCLDYGKPLMAETPVWTKEVVTKAEKKGIPLQIAEQTPWLPSEQFKMNVLGFSRYGKPHTVVNDFRTFEYHGLAQLRRYIGFDKVPVEVCGMSHGVPMATFKDGNNVTQSGHTENWESGQIRFASGEMAIYNFSSLYNRCKYRSPCSLRIYTDRASLVNHDNDINIRVALDVDDGLGYSTMLVKTNPGRFAGKTQHILGELYKPDGPLLETYAWEAQTEHLTDQQEALKVLVDNFADHIITSGGQRLKYDASQGWTDFNLLMAIRHSGASKTYIRR